MLYNRPSQNQPRKECYTTDLRPSTHSQIKGTRPVNNEAKKQQYNKNASTIFRENHQKRRRTPTQTVIHTSFTSLPLVATEPKSFIKATTESNDPRRITEAHKITQSLYLTPKKYKAQNQTKTTAAATRECKETSRN